MRSTMNLPKTSVELKKLPRKKQAELWAKYSDSPYVRQYRALWYYIACDSQNLKIERQHLTKITKYAEKPEDCMVKVTRTKYNLIPGSEIIKTFRGIEFKIMVTYDDKFIFNGKTYSTLSSVAKEICGIKVSGSDFFGLNNKKVKEKANG